MKNEPFPCTSCGACCHHIDRAVRAVGEAANTKESDLYFPYLWDKNGKCEMLSEDNKCMVYDRRPLICDIEKFADYMDFDREAFFAANIKACNDLIDEDGIDEQFKIKEHDPR